jgi:hypothetical protein
MVTCMSGTYRPASHVRHEDECGARLRAMSLANRSGALLTMFVAVMTASSCTGSEVETGSQVSSPAAASLPTSQASSVVPLESSTAITVLPRECPEVSGYKQADAGMLSVGSFTAEDIGPPPPGQDGHKLWIISRRRGHDDAILQLNGPGGQHRLERRKSGASWTAGVEQFYAGSLSVAESGIYRLRITVGRDTMCVRVHYRAT